MGIRHISVTVANIVATLLHPTTFPLGVAFNSPGIRVPHQRPAPRPAPSPPPLMDTPERAQVRVGGKVQRG